jgi:hypothetical protein
MLLGSANLAVGDTRRYTVSYRGFLLPGIKIKAVAVTIEPLATPGPDGYTATSLIGASTIAPTTDPDETVVIFWVVAGVLNEAFTVQVQITDTNNQIVNDTIDLQVVSP